MLLNLIGFYEKEVRIYKGLALGIAIMKFSNNNSIKQLNTDKGMFRFTDSPPQIDNSEFPKLRELSIFSKVWHKLLWWQNLTGRNVRIFIAFIYFS